MLVVSIASIAFVLWFYPRVLLCGSYISRLLVLCVWICATRLGSASGEAMSDDCLPFAVVYLRNEGELHGAW